MTEDNPYPMPFLLRVEKAARLIARAIERRRRFYVLPWPMALLACVLRVLPRPVYDVAFARAPRNRAARVTNEERVALADDPCRCCLCPSERHAQPTVTPSSCRRRRRVPDPERSR
jgi:hypothetical protein